MFESETACIAKFILDAVPDCAPYYYKVPEAFQVPSVYFPPPELSSKNDTVQGYANEYSWHIKFFALNSQNAYSYAIKAHEAIKKAGNKIPAIGADGSIIKHTLRLKNLSVKIIDDGVAQLTVNWISLREYDTAEYERIQKFYPEINKEGY